MHLVDHVTCGIFLMFLKHEFVHITVSEPISDDFRCEAGYTVSWSLIYYRAKTAKKDNDTHIHFYEQFGVAR